MIGVDSAGSWAILDEFVADDAAPDDNFGRGIALEGSDMVIGAHGTADAAYIFDIGGLGAPSGPNFVSVALGDSFASGEGSDRFESVGTTLFENSVNFDSVLNDNTLTHHFPVGGEPGNACHRSLANYAKINIDLFEPAQSTLLVDRTCSGALADPASVSPPPIIGLDVGSSTGDRDQALVSSQLNQALWVLDLQSVDPEQVDVVTVSMGGNDMGFAKLIQACIVSSVARQAIEKADILTPGIPDPLIELAEQYVKGRWVNCAALDPIFAETAAGLVDLAEMLPGAYGEIAQTFPNARVLQVNYPVFLPEEDLIAGQTCGGIQASDSAHARGVAAELNALIAAQVAVADALHPNDFEVVDISASFGPNPLCPVDDGDRYFVNVPDGVLVRVLDRIFDPSQLPGQALAGAVDPLTLAACATAWVPGVDCFTDDYLGLFLDWFQTEEGIEVLQAQLATVDPGIPADQVDGASFENFRNLFHPNARAFEVIACNVLATYDGSDPSVCVPGPVSPLTKRRFDGSDINDRFPKNVQPGRDIDFEFNGFAPGSLLDVFLQSDPVDLGSFTVDAAGEVTGSVVMPAATPGVHQVTFLGIASGGQDRSVTVLVDFGGLPVPGKMFGVYFDGFGSFEDVAVEYLGGDYGHFRADGNGSVNFAVPVPDYAAVGDVPLTVSTDTTPPQTVQVTSVPPTGDPCDEAVPTIEGTDSNDVLLGTGSDDVIFAGAGNDTIFGFGGDDLLCGGDGDDVILGSGGDDTIVAGNGDNTVYGGPGDDVITAGSGDDTVFAGSGDDTVDTAGGNDNVAGGPGDDSCVNAETTTSC